MPPVGDLRWKAPQDPDSWIGVRDAISPAPKCTQLFTTNEWIRTGVVDPASNEDCLYIDIYRPLHNARLPVYVWIHGGSNNFGSARDYDGTAIATRSDVVVVVVQYRLGPSDGLPSGSSDRGRPAFRLGEFRNAGPCPSPKVDRRKHCRLRRRSS